MASHNDLGHIGEGIAVDHLLEKGYQILEKNWRYQKAEVDIIAQKNELLIAVEVKTRTNTDFGDPQDFVSKKKIKLLTMAVDQYVSQHDLDVEVRFDIIAVSFDKKEVKIEHLEDAFLHF